MCPLDVIGPKGLMCSCGSANIIVLVLQVDLKKLGISNFGELGSGMLGDCANDKLELKYQDKVCNCVNRP